MSTKRKLSWAEMALKEANKSESKAKVGAVVIGRGGVVLGRGYNISRDNTVDGKKCAEVRAIGKVPYDAKKNIEIVVVVRARKSQKFGLAKPCAHCQEYLKLMGVGTVYYTNNENEGLEVWKP